MDSDSIPAELLELKAHFDRWRATRKYKHEPFPDELRSAVLEMNQRYSSALLERVLKIQMWSLRKRGAAKAPAKAAVRTNSPKSSQAAFFQLPTTNSFSLDSSPLGSTHCRLALERPDGSRLCLTFPAVDAATIKSLCAEFLRG
jgi:hypothetical protein